MNRLQTPGATGATSRQKKDRLGPMLNPSVNKRSPSNGEAADFTTSDPRSNRSKPRGHRKNGSLGSVNGDGFTCVMPRHLFERYRLVIARVAGLSELHHALRHHLLHGFARGLQVVARVELFRSLH